MNEPNKNLVDLAQAAQRLLGPRADNAPSDLHPHLEFVAMLAHELKAPLAAIEGYLRMIKDRTVGDDPAAYRHMIDRSLVRADQMQAMIQDLLDLSRLECGDKKRQLAPMDLRALCAHCVETVAPLAAARRITLHLEPDGAITLFADRGEIEIILNNLISNAVKYNRDGGNVDIRLSLHGHTVTIAVTDTGIGMSDDEARRLFHNFVRIKNDKTRSIVGSGLGLCIVKKLAQLYGGEVSVQSQADVGSTFIVKLQSPSPSDSPSTGQA